MKVPRAEKKFSVDQMMLNVASSLVRDFQNCFNDPGWNCDYHSAVREGNIARIRNSTPETNSDMDVAQFKATYQIQSLLKRYRFREDIYTDEELTEKAIESFWEVQRRLKLQDLNSLAEDSQRVLNLASAYISKTLGMYSDEECRDLARFGRKASVGIPSRKACEAERWELPISGSPEQISWFDSEMSQNVLVQDYWTRQRAVDPSRSTYHVSDSLTLMLVPKTFKALRSIMPNTTIGSYWSYGIGEMIRLRLKRVGYNIKSLQMRHRYLACQGSVHSLSVTADLSSASDSISVALVRRLLPKDWFENMNRSRMAYVVLPDGSLCESETFCTMGIGYTFPLQTLIFLALLKAIEATLYDRRDRRTISVYGDDMIYNRRMHTAVVTHFERLGFVINLDKTFHEGQFRESCGGDYYRGRDVRPFQPRNGEADVGPKAYEAILYKFVNGLLARWSEYEVAGTLDYLTSEIEHVTRRCKLVPFDYPDDSGIKCPTIATHKFLSRTNVCHPVHVGHGIFRFSYLRLKPELRKEKRHAPYYWRLLRSGNLPDNSFSGRPPLVVSLSPRALLIEASCGVRDTHDLLITLEDRPPKVIRSKWTGNRFRRTSTYVTVSHTGRYTRDRKSVV